MKKTIVTLSLVFTFFGCLYVQAQTCRFPAYQTADYTLTFNMDFGPGYNYTTDSVHHICAEIFSYPVHGLVPSADESRMIALTGGSANPSQSNTLPAALCRILQAYSQNNLNSINALLWYRGALYWTGITRYDEHYPRIYHKLSIIPNNQ